MTTRTFTFSVSNTTALEAFASSNAELQANGVAQFPSPSLAVLNNGSYPWDATFASTQVPEPWNEVPLLDWSHMMDYDPVSKRYYACGGRPSTSGNDNSKLSLKMVEYDEIANQWRSRDSWAANSYAGHLYRSTTVLTGPRHVAYHPHNASAYGLRVFTWDIANAQEGPELPTPPTNLGGHSSNYGGRMFLCWFPTMGAEGSLIYADYTWWRVAKFDWANRAAGSSNWVSLTNGAFDAVPFGASQQHINGHYHPVVNRMLLGNSGGAGSATESPLILVEPDGSVSMTRNPCPVSFGSGGGSTGGPCVPHSTLPLSILFSRADQHIWTFDWRIEDSGVGEPWVDRGPMPAQIQGAQTIALPHPSGQGVLFCKYGANGTSTTWYWKEPAAWT